MADDGTGSAPPAVTWRLLCERPLLYHCADFLSPEECEAVVRMARMSAPGSLTRIDQDDSAKLRVDLDASRPQCSNDEDAAVLRRIEKRVVSLSGVPSHDGEQPWAVHFTPPAQTDMGDAEHMSLGLHVDTNNCRERRWVTFIAYLKTTMPAAGG
eukprot:gnl/TRDRNA2_/TRDRNA2_163830_c0_seq2.p2 gnl/TRDRNA2_/TRDRNA2_163830_c0~~gnl/TRDRNA2_/TRDRNA2_163830_c0_seq2.p2  ORF type:complete len:173 (+),score=27.84 gnl/TRDRNA2_/TRDRNA2_163830_c0_seq2:56-520(+)